MTVLRLCLVLLGILWLAPALAAVPPAAGAYRRDLVREARATWGMSAPVATFAAQVHQESGWRPEAQSRFAAGLAQFTPATAAWISGAYRDTLGTADVYNPRWALRALVTYDRHLYERIGAAASECDRWAFTLSAYNGGPGWIDRDRALAASRGADPSRWWGHVERHSGRAAWAFDENRGYPRRILRVIQPSYTAWGPGVPCP